MPLQDEFGNGLYLANGKCKNVQLDWSFGNILILVVPEETQTIVRGKRRYLGQFPDLNLVWFAQIEN